MLIEKIKEHWNQYKETRGPDNGLRASNSGKCARSIAYKYHGFEGAPLNWRARLVFGLGDMVEKQCVDVMKNYGLTDMQKECSVTIDGVEIKGHIDGLFQGLVVDFKSTTTFGFKNAKKGDVGDYLHTMHFYMKALGLKQALLVYYCKEQSDLCEVLVNWDDTAWAQVEERFRKVLKSTKENLPAREYGPNAKGALPWNCTYCAFTKNCWPNYTLSFSDAGKPVMTVRQDDGLSDNDKFGTDGTEHAGWTN